MCGNRIIEVLGLDQIKILKLLTFTKRLGMDAATREDRWIVYTNCPKFMLSST